MPGRSRCCHVLAPKCATGGPSGPPMLRFRQFSCPWRSSPPSKVHPLDPQRLFGPLSAFEGPWPGPSAPVSGLFRLQRSTHWTLSACLETIPPSKVHGLDPQRLFGDNSAFEGPPAGSSATVSGLFRLQRSIPWTLSACLETIPPSKVHPLDPQRLFRGYSGSKGPSLGPSASVWASFRLRRSTHWTLSATCGRIELVGNTVSIWHLRKILGANGAEDY